MGKDDLIELKLSFSLSFFKEELLYKFFEDEPNEKFSSNVFFIVLFTYLIFLI